MLLAECRGYRPLTAEEELYLLSLRPDSEAIGVLIKSNVKLLIRVSRQYTGDLEDLLAVAMTGFMEGVTRFDVSRGIRLNTYAVHWARKRLRLHVTQHNSESTFDVYESDPSVTEPTPEFDAEQRAKVKLAVAELPVNMQRVMELRYYNGNCTMDDAARALGISKTYVHKLEHEALAMLKERLG